MAGDGERLATNDGIESLCQWCERLSQLGRTRVGVPRCRTSWHFLGWWPEDTIADLRNARDRVRAIIRFGEQRVPALDRIGWCIDVWVESSVPDLSDFWNAVRLSKTKRLTSSPR